MRGDSSSRSKGNKLKKKRNEKKDTDRRNEMDSSFKFFFSALAAPLDFQFLTYMSPLPSLSPSSPIFTPLPLPLPSLHPAETQQQQQQQQLKETTPKK